MVQTVRRCLDVNLEELQQELERKRSALGEEAYQKLRTGLEALRYLQELVADQDMTMAELRRLVHVHGGTEKTREVLRRPASRLRASVPPRPPRALHPMRGRGRRPPAMGVRARPRTQARAGSACRTRCSDRETAVRNAGKGSSTRCGSPSGRFGSWARRP